MLLDSVVFAIIFGGLFALYWIGKALQGREEDRRELEEWKREVERHRLARQRYDELFKFPFNQEED